MTLGLAAAPRYAMCPCNSERSGWPFDDGRFDQLQTLSLVTIIQKRGISAAPSAIAAPGDRRKIHGLATRPGRARLDRKVADLRDRFHS